MGREAALREIKERMKKQKSHTCRQALCGQRLTCKDADQVINKRRSEKPEVRQMGREAALREIKERMKKQKSEKAASKSAPSKQGGKGAGKAAQPKAGAKAGKR